MKLFDTSRWIDIEALPPDPTPPKTLGRFFLKYMGQIKGVLIALAIGNMLAALFDVSLPWFVGQIIDRIGEAKDWESLWTEQKSFFLFAAFVIAVIIPIESALHYWLLTIFMPRFAPKIRRQSHWYVLQQSVSFFHNDFAGRIANKLSQTPYAVRSVVERGIEALWYVITFAGTTFILLFQANVLLTIPALLWLLTYMGILRFFIPRIRRQSEQNADDYSDLIGKITDSYTNILTVKLFARKENEDRYTLKSMHKHARSFEKRERLIWIMRSLLSLIHHVMLVSSAAVALYLWGQGAITAGTIAMALPLLLQITRMSGWIMSELTTIFENIGIVDDGIKTISQPLSITDRPNAADLKVTNGALTIQNIAFHYGKKTGIIDDLSLAIPAEQKLGLIGPSGAGKSTLVSLLLRLYDLEGGKILIDGQDIAAVTQDSLRRQIAVVTQDTSLLHRSIRDNVTYGAPDATDSRINEALRRARADVFIETLTDSHGRRGLDAHVGERGVKLSGGQRQRIAIARAILKD
ncbi:MAG: ABC transporter ATP-binding protein, partial [Alphaproteobacteria bacterium]|nr:ABC transporter ATP-binding protein [Alphaproteobacteria bacterium]